MLTLPEVAPGHNRNGLELPTVLKSPSVGKGEFPELPNNSGRINRGDAAVNEERPSVVTRRAAKRAGKAFARGMHKKYPDLPKPALDEIARAFTQRILRGPPEGDQAAASAPVRKG
jgi:hypothetical protein